MEITIETVIKISLWVLNGAVILIWMLAKDKYKKMEGKTEEAYKLASESVQAQTKIKDNYVERFDEIKDLINTRCTNLESHIQDLHIELVKEYVPKSFCEKQHQIT